METIHILLLQNSIPFLGNSVDQTKLTNTQGTRTMYCIVAFFFSIFSNVLCQICLDRCIGESFQDFS